MAADILEHELADSIRLNDAAAAVGIEPAKAKRLLALLGTDYLERLAHHARAEVTRASNRNVRRQEAADKARAERGGR